MVVAEIWIASYFSEKKERKKDEKHTQIMCLFKIEENLEASNCR